MSSSAAISLKWTRKTLRPICKDLPPELPPTYVDPDEPEGAASNSSSNLDDQPVLRGLVRNGIAAAEHVLAHVGDDQAFWPDQRQLFGQLPVSKVHLHRLVVHISLGYEQICIAPKLDQAVGPFGIAAKGKHLAVDRYPIAVIGLRRQPMAHPDGSDFGIAEAPWTLWRKLDQRHLELLRRQRRFRKGRLHLARKPLFDRRRTRNGERTRALCHELGVEDEERHPAAMVGVVVSEDDQVDCITIDAEALHRNQRRGAAIDKKIQLSGHHVKAGIEAPPGPERIAAADELKMHIRVLSPPTSKTSIACRASNESKTFKVTIA